MTTNDDKYYKSMYHTMFYAAEAACKWITDGKDPIWAAEILMQAMRDCERIYVNEDIPTHDERKAHRARLEQFLAEKAR